MTIGDLNQNKFTTVNPPTGADAAKSIENRKLKDAAEQFEAIFMQELLKPLQSTSSDGMGGEDKDAPAGSDNIVQLWNRSSSQSHRQEWWSWHRQANRAKGKPGAGATPKRQSIKPSRIFPKSEGKLISTKVSFSWADE